MKTILIISILICVAGSFLVDNGVYTFTGFILTMIGLFGLLFAPMILDFIKEYKQ